MSKLKRRDRRKELHFPVLVVKSNYPNSKDENDALKEDNFLRNRRSRRSDQNKHLCLSERGPRPKPDREWSPMSNRELKKSLVTNKYGNDGLYSKRVDNLYQILTRQNSTMLPPVKTSRRIRQNVYDDAKVKEKKYVMTDFLTEGKMSKFARDQCYVPSVYSQFLNCSSCKKHYVNDKYIEEYKNRNQRLPNCINSSANKKVHFCDVLGKRCCSACIEFENRHFSRTIEDKLQTPEASSTSSYNGFCYDFG